MKPYITTSGLAVGYRTPEFPSLTFNIGSDGANSVYLFYAGDMYLFTLYWTLIVFIAVYLAAGVIAALCKRHVVYSIQIVLAYIVYGACQAVVSGSLVGLLLVATYKTGSFPMTTWLPFVFALAQILFVLVSSYPSTSVLI